jgi:DNA polymerase delta subunit 1
MALDIVEEANGARFRIWGTTPTGASVLCEVSDFEPYFYIAAPKRCNPSTSSGIETDDALRNDEIIDWTKDPRQLFTLCSILNRSAPLDSQIQRIEPVTRRPILYYRPDSPQGDTYLKLVLAPGGSVRRAGTQILRAITNRPGLRTQGFVWRDHTVYEHEVSPLQRVLADLPCSGGAWLMIPPSVGAGTAVMTPLKTSEGPSTSGINVSTFNTATTSVITTTNGQKIGYALLQSSSSPASSSFIDTHHEKVSTADLEVIAPWKSIICLTPDATQLADSTWSPFNASNTRPAVSPSAAAVHAAEAARRGDIAPVRLMVMDVCSATRDGKDRAPVATQGDPIVAISCTVVPEKVENSPAEADDKNEKEKGIDDVPEVDDFAEVDTVGDDDEINGGGGSAKVVAPSAAAVLGGPRSAQHAAVSVKIIKQGTPRPVVFLLSSSLSRSTTITTIDPSSSASGVDRKSKTSLQEFYSGAEIVLCLSEAELLLTWQHYVMRIDPDVIALFQVGTTLETISQRFQALGITSSYSTNSGIGTGNRGGGGVGGLQLSRLLPQHAKHSISIRRITMYSAAWVRSQSRMSSTSNQETFKVDIDGRLVVDVLRQVLTSQNLASFSLVDCVQSILGETMEVLGAHIVASLAGINSAASSSDIKSMTEEEEEEEILKQSINSVRVARYTFRRTAAVHALLNQLGTIPEAIEMARATGLTIGQVM